MTYTLQQFGQKIKEKYPTMRNMNDEDVARKILSIYPQYKSQVSGYEGDSTPDTSNFSDPDTAKKSLVTDPVGSSLTLAQIISRPGDVAETFLRNLIKAPGAIYGPSSPIIGGALKVQKNIAEGSIAAATQGLKTIASGFEPETETLGGGYNKVIQGAMQTALAPVTGTLQALPGGETALQILNAPFDALGAIFEWAGNKAGLDTESEEFQTAKSQLVTAAAVSAPYTVPKLAGVSGKVFKKAGIKAGEAVLPTGAKEAEAMQAYEAGVFKEKPRTVGQTAIERGVTGTQKGIGVKAVKEMKNIFEKEVNPALKASKETITREELFKPIEAKIESTVEPGRKAELQAALDAIKEEYVSPEFDTVSLELAQKIKQGLDEFTPQKAFKGQEIGSAYNQLRNDMADTIRKLTYDKLKDIKVKEKYIDYSNLKELEKLGIKVRQQKAGVLRPGGTETLIKDIWDMAAVPVATKAGGFLYSVGKFLEFFSPQKVKTVGEYLEKQGVDQATFESKISPPESFKSAGAAESATITGQSLQKKLATFGAEVEQSGGWTPEKISEYKRLSTQSELENPTRLGETKKTYMQKFKGEPNLSSENKTIESKAFHKILDKEDQILSQYKKEHDKIVNTDNFRPYFKDVGYNGINSAAVQKPASYLSKRAYTEGLKNEGEYVLGTGGGSGVGKSSALENIPEYNLLKEKSAVILDSNLSSWKSLESKVKEAWQSGKTFVEFYIYREPIDSFINGVVKRMKDNPKEMGRLVPTKEVAANHIGSWNVAKSFEDSGSKVYYVDNSLGKGNQKLVSREYLESKIKYPLVEELTQKLNQIAKQLYDADKITKQEYEAYVE